MKTKQIILTIALLFTTLLTIAQDKYEFMIIEFTTYKNIISVSIDGKEYIEEKANYAGQEKTGYNANPFLNKVKEYQDKGWEVINFNSTINGGTTSEVHFAHLRKKKVDTK